MTRAFTPTLNLTKTNPGIFLEDRLATALGKTHLCLLRNSRKESIQFAPPGLVKKGVLGGGFKRSTDDKNRLEEWN